MITHHLKQPGQCYFPYALQFARSRKLLSLRQTYFVDNVTTSGNTLAAARAALGFGAGLVFADAAPRRVQLQATLFEM